MRNGLKLNGEIVNLLQTQNGRSFLFTLLYMCEGGPIGFICWALPAMLRLKGVSVENITALTALLVLPWAFKFLSAPLRLVFEFTPVFPYCFLSSLLILCGRLPKAGSTKNAKGCIHRRIIRIAASGHLSGYQL